MGMNADGTATLGPGTLKIGPVVGATSGAGSDELDVSCLVNNARIVPDVSAGDSKTMLCGRTKTAADTITWAISGSVDTDGRFGDGFLAFTWLHAGKLAEFEFIPSNDQGTSVKGQLKVAPLEMGADDYGEYQDSDFEFGLDNFDPATDVTWGAATGSPIVSGTVPLTGVTAGTPGTYQPSTATPPWSFGALVADPIIGSEGSAMASKAAFTTGQYVKTGNNDEAYWTGTEWKAGRAS